MLTQYALIANYAIALFFLGLGNHLSGMDGYGTWSTFASSAGIVLVLFPFVFGIVVAVWGRAVKRDRQWVATTSVLSSRRLRRIITCSRLERRYYALRNPKTPRDLLESAIYGNDEWARGFAAANPQCPDDLLVVVALRCRE